MKLLKTIVCLFALTQLGACAIMSKQDCLSADWRDVGYDVGFTGEKEIATAYNRRAEACAKHGTKASWPAFKIGHAEGIEQYCQVDNGLVLGLRGHSRAIRENTCPERDHPGFGRAFADGYRLYELNNLVYSSAHELERLENQIHRLRHKRADLKRLIKSGELSDEEFHHADHKRKLLRRQILALQSEVYACREQLHRYQAHASAYTQKIELEYGQRHY